MYQRDAANLNPRILVFPRFSNFFFSVFPLLLRARITSIPSYNTDTVVRTAVELQCNAIELQRAIGALSVGPGSGELRRNFTFHSAAKVNWQSCCHASADFDALRSIAGGWKILLAFRQTVRTIGHRKINIAAARNTSLFNCFASVRWLPTRYRLFCISLRNPIYRRYPWTFQFDIGAREILLIQIMDEFVLESGVEEGSFARKMSEILIKFISKVPIRSF